MFIERDSTNMVETQKACARYDEYAQCHACGWFGCVADFPGQAG